MLVLALTLTLAAQLAADALPTGTYDGTCLYPEAVQERAAPGELVACNQARVNADSITFGRRGWQTHTRFNGAFQGDRLTVTSVTLPNGRAVDVRGVCEIYHADNAVSTIACTATSTRGSMAANFVVSTINNAR